MPKLLQGVQTVLVSNGRTLSRFELGSKKLDRAELLSRMIGPTGNLRAPTVRRGPLLVVGYHADSMKALIAGA